VFLLGSGPFPSKYVCVVVRLTGCLWMATAKMSQLLVVRVINEYGNSVLFSLAIAETDLVLSTHRGGGRERGTSTVRRVGKGEKEKR
jgi:hypothetical protein